jgi:Uma2 family endonuclease
VDRRRFSLHEEEDVVEIPQHRRQVVYFETNLRIERPDCFVGANMGVYWIPGQDEHPWVGPDVFVAPPPPNDPGLRVWLVWEDGPIQFVAEVASEQTRRSERRKREEIYREALQVPEYLYTDLERHQLELWRLREGNYQRVREEGGRLYSEELRLWFGWGAQERLVRIWTADGRMLPTAEEKEQRLQEDAARRQEAEQRAQEEQRLRQEAEQRLQMAEQRAQEAEARAAALAAELERLRRGTA